MTELNELIRKYKGYNTKLRAHLLVADDLSKHTFLTHLRRHTDILEDLYKLQHKESEFLNASQYQAETKGCQSSRRLPSGSVIHAKRP
ncbi:hypothetical protein BH10ACI4_BH10ACI4_25510 [soil metagenome]